MLTTGAPKAGHWQRAAELAQPAEHAQITEAGGVRKEAGAVLSAARDAPL